MNKKKIEILITSVLIIVIILALPRLLSVKNRKTANQMVSNVVTKVGNQAVSKEKADERLIQIKNKLNKISWDRNPFLRGYSSGKSGITALNLTGIIWDIKDPQAIIDETVVKQGDLLGKYKIIKINKDNVVVNGDEGQLTLRIWEEEK